jgi:hypothetical protein
MNNPNGAAIGLGNGARANTRAVGVTGSMVRNLLLLLLLLITMIIKGQLFTVYAENWNCKDCGQENFANRNRCFRCKGARSSDDTKYIANPALEALQSGQEIHWQEVIDPNSYQM